LDDGKSNTQVLFGTSPDLWAAMQLPVKRGPSGKKRSYHRGKGRGGVKEENHVTKVENTSWYPD